MTEVIDDQHPQSAARPDPWVACNRSVLSTNMSVSSYTWSGLSHDLAAVKSRGRLRALLERTYPDLITHNPQPRPGRYGRSVSEGRWRARNDGLIQPERSSRRRLNPCRRGPAAGS